MRRRKYIYVSLSDRDCGPDHDHEHFAYGKKDNTKKTSEDLRNKLKHINNTDIPPANLLTLASDIASMTVALVVSGHASKSFVCRVGLCSISHILKVQRTWK